MPVETDGARGSRTLFFNWEGTRTVCSTALSQQSAQVSLVGLLVIRVTILNRFSADRPRHLPMADGDERRVKLQRASIAMVGTSILIYRFDEGDLARWRSWAEQNAVGESAVGSRE